MVMLPAMKTAVSIPDTQFEAGRNFSAKPSCRKDGDFLEGGKRFDSEREQPSNQRFVARGFRNGWRRQVVGLFKHRRSRHRFAQGSTETPLRFSIGPYSAAQEDGTLSRAIGRVLQGGGEDFRAFEDYVRLHSASGWNLAILTNAGLLTPKHSFALYIGAAMYLCIATRSSR